MNKIYIIVICLFMISCEKNDEDIALKLKGKIKKITHPAYPDIADFFYYNSNLELSDYKYIEKQLIVSQQSYIYKEGRISEIQMYNTRRSEQDPKDLIRSFLFYYNDDDLLDSIHDVNVINNTHILATKYFYKFNKNKQIIKNIQINLIGVPDVQHDTIFSDYQYDNLGNVVSVYIKSNSELGGSRLNSRFEYTYDKKPNPRQNWKMINFLPSLLPIHVSPNNIVREVAYNLNNELFLETQYEYEYNSDEKPIKEIRKYVLRDGMEQNDQGESVIEYY